MGRREKIFGLLAVCLLGWACVAGSSWQEWTESTLRPLSPPDEEDYRDLRFLDTLLAGKTFIILGEETHGEEVTTAYKVRLIRYLNRQRGYTVLLTEGLNFHTPATAAAAKENASLAYLGSDLFSPFTKSSRRGSGCWESIPTPMRRPGALSTRCIMLSARPKRPISRWIGRK